jgi:GTPase
LKSTLRGLVSWAPHYAMLCIPANCGAETPGSEQVVFQLFSAQIELFQDCPVVRCGKQRLIW